MIRFLLCCFLICTAISCSGVKTIEGVKANRGIAETVDTSKLYSLQFLNKVNQIKEKYRQGKIDLALAELRAMSDEHLKMTEKASKNNLLGVMDFAKKNYDDALKNFQVALGLTKEDPYLEAQIYLNIASVYFKTGQKQRAFETLSLSDFKNLQPSEAKKFHQLYALLSEDLGKKDLTLAAQLRSYPDKKNLSEMKLDPHFQQFEEKYLKLSETERTNLIDAFSREKNLPLAMLILNDISRFLKTDQKDKVASYGQLLESRYSDNQQIMSSLKELKTLLIATNEKITPMTIGVVLPLSGERKSLGERALNGIELALAEVNQLLSPSPSPLKIETKDTESSIDKGVTVTRELIEISHVSVVIGGLIPASATKEYLEAKNHGALFISLSPVNLPKEDKNSLLIEVPGSIESQVGQIFTEKMLQKLGKKGAIIYPKGDLGDAYANEFWRQAKKNNVEVTGLVSYDKNASEFKDPVKNLLGMKFTREREEELPIVNDIARLEKNKNIKRLQNLQPILDFDWVFVPGHPKEALQIMPNFNYFDAFNLSFIGVPSWRSELMTNEGYRYGSVFFVDEVLPATETEFSKAFSIRFNREPKIVETFSYDAAKFAYAILSVAGSEGTRKDIQEAMIKKGSLTGESGSWKLDDGLWSKNLSIFKLKRDGPELIEK